MAGIDPKYYYLTLGLLILCTLVGLFVAYKLQRDVQDSDAPPTEKEVLGPLERAYYSGLMTEEEFKRIRGSMAKQNHVYDESLDGPAAGAKGRKIAKPPLTLAEATRPSAPTEPETGGEADVETEADPQA